MVREFLREIVRVAWLLSDQVEEELSGGINVNSKDAGVRKYRRQFISA